MTKHTPEHIEKIRQALLGKKHSMERRENERLAQLGRKLSQEHRDNISRGMLGRKFSDETLKKLREIASSPEHIEKLRYAATGSNNPMFGRHHSDETKQKIRQIHLGNKYAVRQICKGGYGPLHRWIKRRLSKPDRCQMCDKIKRLDLSNISGNYLMDLNDWQWLCKVCHKRFDHGSLFTILKYSREII